MAPLKLYANITGKFTVERDLVNVQDTIRSTTLDAEKIRKERGITMLDAPPNLSSSSQTKKKRKNPPGSSSLFRNPVAQPRPSISTSTRAPSPLPPAPSAAPSPLRTAVVKALAVKERTVDELLRLIHSDHDVEKRKRKLLDLLSQMAEQPNATKSPSLWRLKPATWVEVRPYEWADLTAEEKTVMARTARLTFNNLNIPESDPVWAHVVYRTETPMVASGSGSSKAAAANRPPVRAEAPKRGVSSKEAKEKKAKPKPDPKAEILMRDESKPAPRASNVSAKGKEVDDGPSPSASKAAARKTPGSGFRIAKVPSPDTPNPLTPPVPVSNPAPRGVPRDVRNNGREPPRASLPAKPAPPIAPPVQEKKAPPRIKKVKETATVPEKQRERAPEGSGKDPLKRKKPSQDMDDPDVVPGAKRRRTEGMVSGSTPRDLSLPKKPETNTTPTSRSLPSKAIKKESSPLPPTTRPHKSRNEGSSLPPPPRSSLPARPPAGSTSSNHTYPESHSSKSSSQTQRSNSSTSKRRERRSPIYTSSEDEGEIRASTGREPAPLPTPPATTTHRSRAQQPSAVSRPLPTDRDGLRARYNATYLKYLSSYHQLFAQQSKLESLLSGTDGSTISDSDGDGVEVLSPEDTMKLKADHKRWERELENIRGIFTTPERSESKSD
ncbi:hypothetical protein DFH07DRAFT_754709 [Mycena maculata]|uniref:RNA polymerase II elongation factor ELL N-terminal domain-containing protein n=1 Tax=Mycena maculata TaxID=230809 RepID=A0AAD7I2N6_9AGAR|nr:hypothetical protein DFH07DRAFT_754709 [Mycena maculata]